MAVERAAMVSPRGSSKWLDCGNPGCQHRVDPGKPATGERAGEGQLQPTFKTCAKCRSEAYCSTECQKLCWKMHHKTLCKDGTPPLPWLPSSRLFADELSASGMGDLEDRIATLLLTSTSSSSAVWKCGGSHKFENLYELGLGPADCTCTDTLRYPDWAEPCATAAEGRMRVGMNAGSGILGRSCRNT